MPFRDLDVIVIISDAKVHINIYTCKKIRNYFIYVLYLLT